MTSQLTQEESITTGSFVKRDPSRDRSHNWPDFGVKKKKKKPDNDPGLQRNKKFCLHPFQWKLKCLTAYITLFHMKMLKLSK